MNEEEKEAIIKLKHYASITKHWKQEEFTDSEIDNYIKINLNYIEKLQKENKELKEENQRIKDINVELNTDVSAWKTTVEELRKELKE